MRQVIDVNGYVRHRYSYGPFGKKLEANDDPDGPGNNFQFTGQYFDAEIDQYFLRARQYDPKLHIFTSRDPAEGEFKEPLSLHKYLYCLNDPVNSTDPTGYETLPELNSSMLIKTDLDAHAASGYASVIGSVKSFVDALNYRNGLVSAGTFLSGGYNAWVRAVNAAGQTAHHIVGRGWGNMNAFGRDTLNSFGNLLSMDPAKHGQITAFFNSGYKLLDFMKKNPDFFGKFGKVRTIQEFVSRLPYSEQARWGWAAYDYLMMNGTMKGFDPKLYGLLLDKSKI